jgi:aryl-alcohol dehydrogenase-like predicted oxidoreductase
MKKRPFGRTGLQVSEIGMGTWGFGGEQWRDLDPGRAERTLYDAIEAGVTLIDTAPTYGDGFAEKVVGAAVRELRARDSVIVASKVPPATEEWPPQEDRLLSEVFPSEHVVASVEESLRRSRLEVIPVAQLHVWLDEWLEHDHWTVLSSTMKRLVKEGKVLHWGVSSIRHRCDDVLKVMEEDVIESVQVIFNVFDQGPRRALLAKAAAHDVAVVGRCPLDEGALTGTVEAGGVFPVGDWRNRYFTEARRRELEKHLAPLRNLLGDHASSLAELALRYCLSHTELTSVIPGMRNREHLLENIGCSDSGPLAREVLAILSESAWARDWYDNSN